jgi:hypothetical protein
MMDCRTCEPTLIDLVHSELATDAAREAHAHLATCASCRASFETLVAATKLAAQLPMVDPPPHVAPRVMELAEAHARDVAARQRVVAPQPTPWQALLDFVGRLATRPQVAMATIMVLIVAVGFWSLPRLRRQASPPVAGVVVNPEPEGEAAPGTGVEPAERLDLKVDLRARRIRSKDGLPAPTAAPSAVAAAPQPATPAANGVLAERDKKADDPLATLDDVDLGEVGRKELTEKPARRASGGSAVGAGSAREFAQGPSAPAKAAAPTPLQDAAKLRKGKASTASSSDALARSNQNASEGPVLGERSAASSAEPEAKYATKSKPAARPQPKLEAESGFAQSPPPAAATAEAAPAEPTAQAASQAAAPSPADLLTSARAHAKRSGCLAASPDYQRLVTRYPNSAEAGSALIELAQCRRISGDVAGARSLLNRATEIPEVAGRARALLADLPSGK